MKPAYICVIFYFLSVNAYFQHLYPMSGHLKRNEMIDIFVCALKQLKLFWQKVSVDNIFYFLPTKTYSRMFMGIQQDLSRHTFYHQTFIYFSITVCYLQDRGEHLVHVQVSKCYFSKTKIFCIKRKLTCDFISITGMYSFGSEYLDNARRTLDLYNLQCIYHATYPSPPGTSMHYFIWLSIL